MLSWYFLVICRILVQRGRITRGYGLVFAACCSAQQMPLDLAFLAILICVAQPLNDLFATMLNGGNVYLLCWIYSQYVWQTDMFQGNWLLGTFLESSSLLGTSTETDVNWNHASLILHKLVSFENLHWSSFLSIYFTTSQGKENYPQISI